MKNLNSSLKKFVTIFFIIAMAFCFSGCKFGGWGAMYTRMINGSWLSNVFSFILICIGWVVINILLAAAVVISPTFMGSKFDSYGVAIAHGYCVAICLIALPWLWHFGMQNVNWFYIFFLVQSLIFSICVYYCCLTGLKTSIFCTIIGYLTVIGSLLLIKFNQDLIYQTASIPIWLFFFILQFRLRLSREKKFKAEMTDYVLSDSKSIVFIEKSLSAGKIIRNSIPIKMNPDGLTFNEISFLKELKALAEETHKVIWDGEKFKVKQDFGSSFELVNPNFSIDFDEVTITADYIKNISEHHSGDLGIELSFFKEKYDGGEFNGFQVSACFHYDALESENRIKNINLKSNVHDDYPDGDYFVVLAILEIREDDELYYQHIFNFEEPYHWVSKKHRIAEKILTVPNYIKNSDSDTKQFYNNNRNKIDSIVEEIKKEYAEKQRQQLESEREKILTQQAEAEKEREQDKKETSQKRSVEDLSNTVILFQSSVDNKEPVNLQLLKLLEESLNSMKNSDKTLLQNYKSELSRNRKYLSAAFEDAKSLEGCTNSAKIRMEEILNMFDEITN